MSFDYNKYKINELKKMCKEEGLNQSGTKQELVQRLETHMMSREAELLGELPPSSSTSATVAPTNEVTMNSTSVFSAASEADLLGESPQQPPNTTVKADDVVTSKMTQSQPAEIDGTKEAPTAPTKTTPAAKEQSERSNGAPPPSSKTLIETQKAPPSSVTDAQQKQKSMQSNDVQDQTDCSTNTKATSSAITPLNILPTTTETETKTSSAEVLDEEARKRAARAQRFGIVSPELLAQQFEQKKAERAKRFGIDIVPDKSTTQSASTVASEQKRKLEARATRFGIETRDQSKKRNSEELDEKMKKRAERFGIPLVKAVSADGAVKRRAAPDLTVNDPEHQEKLKKRAERFGLTSHA